MLISWEVDELVCPGEISREQGGARKGRDVGA